MEKNLGVTEAREKFSEIIEKVQYQGDAFVISRHGKQAAAVVPITVYENWKRQREEYFAAVRKLQEQINLDPAEADRIALEAQQAVRRESQDAQ
jgi:prevent-host-death family protein